MKRIGVFLVLLLAVAFCASAEDDLQALQDAETDAAEDGRNYSGFGWGLAAYGAFFIASPLADILLIPIAFNSAEAWVPAERIAIIQDRYSDVDSFQLYESQYKKALLKIKKGKNGRAALVGTGLAVVTAGVIIAIVVRDL